MNKLSSKLKKKIICDLEKNYECNLNFLFSYNFYIQKNSKISISKIDLNNIDLESLNLRKIINIGIYFGKILDEKNFRFRLSLYGTKLINQKNNYVVLDDLNFSKYLLRENLFEDEIFKIVQNEKSEFLIVKYSNKNYGVISKKNNMYLNYLPKERRTILEK